MTRIKERGAYWPDLLYSGFQYESPAENAAAPPGGGGNLSGALDYFRQEDGLLPHHSFRRPAIRSNQKPRDLG